jgi:hypothetical protein
MARMKQWTCTTPSGNVFRFWALEGLGPMQALDNAGLMMGLDVTSIKEAS